MSTTEQAEQEVVVGVVIGVETKAADKWQVLVNTGQQNPRRLWTKDSNLVQQMMGMIGQHLSFMCGVSHWTNQSGQPVRSLWLNGFGAPGQQAAPLPQQFTQPAPAAPTSLPVQQPGAWAQNTPAPPVAPIPVAAVPQVSYEQQREDRIHRQTATKVAALLLPHLAEDQRNLQNLLAISERLVAYYDNGVAWSDNPGHGDGHPPEAQPSDPDDDIPF
jgi:hypothetical protein